MQSYTLEEVASWSYNNVVRKLRDNNVTIYEDLRDWLSVIHILNNQGLMSEDAVYISYFPFDEIYLSDEEKLINIYNITPKWYRKGNSKENIIRGYLDFIQRTPNEGYTKALIDWYNNKNTDLDIPYLHTMGDPRTHTTLVKDMKLNFIYRNLPVLSYDSDYLKALLENQLPSNEWIRANQDIMAGLRNDNREIYTKLREYISKSDINFSLRQNPGLTSTLDKLFNLTPPLDKPVVVYRYLDCTHMEIPDLFIEPGFMSTTINNSVIASKGKTVAGNPITCIFKIRVPKGTVCAYLGKFQGELLFPRGSRMRLLYSGTTQLPILARVKLNKGRIVSYYEFEML